MVGHEFYTTEGRPVRYNAGQPMGAYSSWPVMALTHHLIVLTAARLTGQNPKKFNGYRLLGDDIVIFDEQVALRYKEIMTDLGMEFSEEKTIVSDQLAEFAKRLIYKGVEITPLNLASLSNCNTLAGVIEFFRSHERKGWDFDLSYGNPGKFYHKLLPSLNMPSGISKWAK